jgi:hypothetical protein
MARGKVFLKSTMHETEFVCVVAVTWSTDFGYLQSIENGLEKALVLERLESR